MLELGSLVGRCAPSRVEQLCKVNERKTVLGATPSSEVEDNGGFHGRKEGVAGAGGAVVEEVGLVDATVFGLGRSLADDTTGRQPNDVL